jgi:hypothetical protein
MTGWYALTESAGQKLFIRHLRKCRTRGSRAVRRPVQPMVLQTTEEYMALSDYSRPPDRFEIDNEQEYTIRAEFAFPCCICKHASRSDATPPCSECGHNVNARTTYHEQLQNAEVRGGNSRPLD